MTRSLPLKQTREGAGVARKTIWRLRRGWGRACRCCGHQVRTVAVDRARRLGLYCVHTICTSARLYVGANFRISVDDHALVCIAQCNCAVDLLMVRWICWWCCGFCISLSCPPRLSIYPRLHQYYLTVTDVRRATCRRSCWCSSCAPIQRHSLLSLLPRSGACRRRAPLFLALGGGGPSTISSRYQFARALEQRLHATALMMRRRESRRRRRRRSLRLGRVGV
jgi:hypothetical protein